MYKTGNKRVQQIFYSLLALLCLSVVILSKGAFADSFQQWNVKSEYQDPETGRTSMIQWTFAKQEAPSSDGGFNIKVSDPGGHVKNWAEFHFDNLGRLVEWKDYRVVRDRVSEKKRHFQADRPALVEPSLVPGDWLNSGLPFNLKIGSYFYTVYRQVGPARFADRLEVRVRSVTVAEAVSQGWLDDFGRQIVQGRDLCLVEVSRLLPAGDKPAFKQLWIAGEEFWLFEEHGLRRSWRCEQ